LQAFTVLGKFALQDVVIFTPIVVVIIVILLFLVLRPDSLRVGIASTSVRTFATFLTSSNLNLVVVVVVVVVKVAFELFVLAAFVGVTVVTFILI